MGIKIKNLQTGEFEKFNIPALKGEKGEPGEIEPSEKVDYIGKQHSKLRDTMNANVDYIIKTAIGEFNYLDYEGQHITATNSIEGHAKSAILKGQTLVNLVPSYTIDYTATSNWDGYYQLVQNSRQSSDQWRALQDLKPNTKYYISCYVETFSDTNGRRYALNNSNDNCIFEEFMYINSVGHFNWVLTSRNEFTDMVYVALRCQNEYSKGAIKIRDIMILEYQEGMENWDIPYFEGMQSVKMPVLMTTGKNLIGRYEKVVYRSGREQEGATLDNDGNFTYVGAPGNRPCLIYKNNPNTSVTVSANVSLRGLDIYEYSDIPNFTREDEPMMLTEYHYSGNQKSITRTTSKEAKYIGISFYNDSNNTGYTNLQLEYGLQATVHEPFKSNILSTPEEVVLRSLPNGVCDTLNLLTGEYVQRIGETTFNGSEHWTLGTKETDNTIRFKTVLQANIPVVNEMLTIISDNFPVLRNADIDVESVQLWGSSKDFNVRILKTKASTVDEFKSYLSQNPLTIQYELATPVVKTVDLSDNHVYSYKGTTHYSCSSEEGSLVPTLSVKVPTDTQLTIQEQKAATQTLLIKNMDLQQSIKEVQAMNLAFNTALYNSFNSIREEVEDIKKHVSTNENLEGSF